MTTDVQARDPGSELRQRVNILSEEELASLVDVSLQTVRNWRSQRAGPRYTKPSGAAVFYFLDDVLEWLKAGRVDTE